LALVYHHRESQKLTIEDLKRIHYQAWQNARCTANSTHEHPDTYEMMFPDEEYEEEQEERIDEAKETAKRLGHPVGDEDELVENCQKLGLKRPD